MALYEWGSPPVNSTGAGTVANPSTASLIAEIDSTQLQIITGSSVFEPRGHAVPVRLAATLGGSTILDWRLEQCLSTGLDMSTAGRVLIPSIFTPTGQSGFYTYTLMVEPGDRIRARLNSSVTGTASAFLQVDPLT